MGWLDKCDLIRPKLDIAVGTSLIHLLLPTGHWTDTVEGRLLTPEWNEDNKQTNSDLQQAILRPRPKWEQIIFDERPYYLAILYKNISHRALLKPHVRTYPMDSRLKKVCSSALGAIWNIRDLMLLSAVFTLPGWCYLEAKWAIVLQVQGGENCAAETGALGASGSQMSR